MMRYSYIILLFAFSLCSSAQNDSPFSKLDLSLTAGSTGVGFDVSTNITDWMHIRTGFDFMPRIEADAHFEIVSMDESGNFSKNYELLNDKLKTFTGYEVKDYIDMTCKPTFYNFKFLMDFQPFKRSKSFWKNFSFTAGFYWGSSEIGTAVNTLEGAQTLNAMLMYNHLYDVALSGEPLVTIQAYDWFTKQYVDQPIYLDANLCDRLREVGRLGAHVGDFTDQFFVNDKGEEKNIPYLMEPDNEGTVRAYVKANSFKPYLGINYGGRLTKKNDRLRISGDLGLLFWGGKPSIITHEGVDLSRDVKDIEGKVGDYVDQLGGLRVYPVLNLRLTYTLF